MRELGLGRAGTGTGAVGLAEARERASEMRRLVKAGTDPLAKREADAANAKAEAAAAAIRGRTFRDVAEFFLASHGPGWRNPKHRQQWRNTLVAYAHPHIGAVPVAEVGTAHVMAALEPIWRTKPETASRVRGRIEAVLDYAAAREWRSGENPARWRGHRARLLPARGRVARVEHHAALPWRDVGAFMAALRQRQGVAARALEFAVLTAARTGEVLGMCWAEVDLDLALWTVPAERMKAGREHRVPLPPAAVELLCRLRPPEPIDHTTDVASTAAPVFPGAGAGRPLSNMAMLMLLRRMGHSDLTAHGFRSSFRDWVAEATNFPRDLAEAALAHVIGDKTEAAYQRGDLLVKRRRLMHAWAGYCAKVTLERDAVVSIGRASSGAARPPAAAR